MANLFSTPLRVYLAFALLLAMGIGCYFTIPVALFPNSTKPVVWVQVGYGPYTREDFIKLYGIKLEQNLSKIKTDNCTARDVKGGYSHSGTVEVHFSWGDDGTACEREANAVLAQFKGQWPQTMANGAHAQLSDEGIGFYFGTFSSEGRTQNEVYNLIEPLMTPKLAAIAEANNPGLNNPAQERIVIELQPEKMAAFKLLPIQIVTKITDRLKTFPGGTLKYEGNGITIEVGSSIASVSDLKKIEVAFDKSKQVYLNEIADIRVVPDIGTQQWKSNGAAAVALYAAPAPGKNIREMSRKIAQAVEETLASSSVPKDIKFAVAIDPGRFIDQAIANVFKEVWLCSLLAVLILFFFIGNFVGTLTALIEIPTSIILSFILMKLFGVQLNMISLGGLALSVGMNVDASIVVIDAIVKQFAAHPRSRSKEAVLKLVVDAVREVQVPVVISTITSLIVFLPLVFTSDLSYAILGDLAKAVIFSHGISLLVAMVLVPTVRIQLAHRFAAFSEHHAITRLDIALEKMYNTYTRILDTFLRRKALQHALNLFVVVALGLAAWLIPPRLTREIVGKPDIDILGVAMGNHAHTSMTQMEEAIAKNERRFLEKMGDRIYATESSAWAATGGNIFMHLKDKTDYQQTLEDLQDLTKGDMDGWVSFFPFNISEMPIPHPPDWRVTFKATNMAEAQEVYDRVVLALSDSGILESVPDTITPVWNNRMVLKVLTQNQNIGLVPQTSDLADVIRLATDPTWAGELTLNHRRKNVYIQYPENLTSSPEDVGALPIPVGDKVVPLRALVDVQESKELHNLSRFQNEDMYVLEGHLSEKEKPREKEILAQVRALVEEFRAKELPTLAPNVAMEMVDAKVELSQALRELLLTIGLAIALIFLVLLLQFSSIVHATIVLLAIPFGILGVLLSLYLFDSTLSLNSGLGVILLVGITVANSIMLVEMIVRLVETGVKVRDAILETAKKRIRPILMTSLTTILGMLPIALGFGEGGKVLQPLGISVCGGLWVSMIFTLFVIPALEYSYLRRKHP